MSGKKIRTMEELSQLSGISRPTLSKYFQDPGSVRNSSRERIEVALQEYEYRPNVFALNQNRKLTRTIGIIVPYLTDPVFGEIARTIERQCIEAGYKVALFSSHGQREYEVEAMDSLLSQRPTGVLLAPLGRDSDAQEIASFCEEVPTVLLDRDIEGVGEAFVGSDNKSFVSQSVEYLIRTGEAPCFFEMRNPSNPNSIARRRHYREMMASHGLEPMIIQVDGEGWEMERIGYEGGIAALERRAFETSTILCSNDRLAVGLMAACYEKGLRVGRGEGCALRVAGHDNHPFSKYTSPPLTTVAHEYDTVSNRGVETLFDLVEQGGRFSERREQVYPARLILRASA